MGGSISVANFYTGYSNNISGYSTNPVVKLSNNGVINATAASRLSESAGAFTTVTMSGTSTYYVQNNLELGYGATP